VVGPTFEGYGWLRAALVELAGSVGRQFGLPRRTGGAWREVRKRWPPAEACGQGGGAKKAFGFLIRFC